MKYIKTFAEFQNELDTNPTLKEQFEKAPMDVMNQFMQTPLNSDKWVYRIVVGSLGLAVILVIIGVIVLSINCKCGDASIPTVLTAIASGAIGALAGLLAPSPTQSNK